MSFTHDNSLVLPLFLLFLSFGPVAADNPNAPQNSATSSLAQGSGTVIIKQEDFESDFPNEWDVFDGDGTSNGEYFWGRDSYRANSGTYSGFIAAGGANGLPGSSANYPNNMDSRMVLGPISLSDASEANVDLMVWLDSEQSFDFLRYMSRATWNPLKGGQLSGNNGGWKAYNLDLRSQGLLGFDEVWVEIRFESDDSTGKPGAWIDDIVISKNLDIPDYDLELQFLDVAGGNVGSSQTFGVTFGVRNLGTVTSPPANIFFYLTQDLDTEVDDYDRLVGPVKIPPLGAGQSIDTEDSSIAFYPLGAADGEWYFMARIMPKDTDTSNNIRFADETITVTNAPDIRIYPNELTLEAEAPPALPVQNAVTTASSFKVNETVPISEVMPRLTSLAALHGRVDVIVGFETAFQPEGFLDATQRQNQRSAIQTGADRLATSLGGQNFRENARFRYIPYVALNLDEQALEALARNPHVLSIEEDRLAKPLMASSNSVIGSPLAWAGDLNGAGQTVAVLDTGFDTDHPWFTTGGSRIAAEACFSSNDPGISESLCQGGVEASTAPGSSTHCDSPAACGHGTHVAGIVAGNDGIGPNFGVAPGADLITIQVFTRFLTTESCSGSAPCLLSRTSDQLLALEQVQDLSATHEIASVNLSLGGGAFGNQASCDAANASFKTAIDNLASLGIATVIAAGNNGYTDSTTAPGCISSAVTVGATTDNDLIAGFSNIADFVDVLAPGVDITSAIPNTIGSKSGTSMATPHVAGAWAILKQQAPDADVPTILNALQFTGKVVDDQRVEASVVGMKRIQLEPALEQLGHQPRNFVIFNQGSSPLVVTSIVPQLPAPWLNFEPAPPFGLEAGGSKVMNLIVDFDTAPAGTFGLNIDIFSNDPDESPWPGGVSLTVINSGTNEKPVANPQSAEAVEDGFLPIILTGSDNEEDPLVFEIDQQPAHGLIELAEGDPGDGSMVIYYPDPGYFGEESFTFVAKDWTQYSDPATVDITVLNKNDPPSFETGGDPSWPIGETGEKSHLNWITNFSPGPENESSQTLMGFIVNVTHDPDGVVAALDVLNNGTLTYILTGASGVAVFEVYAKDNGGTLYGGNDTSDQHIARVEVRTDLIMESGFEEGEVDCAVNGVWAAEARDCSVEDCTGGDKRYKSWDGKLWCRALRTEQGAGWELTRPEGTSYLDFWVDWGHWDHNDCGDGVTSITIPACQVSVQITRDGVEKHLTCYVAHKTTFRIDQIAGPCDYVIIGEPFFY